MGARKRATSKGGEIALVVRVSANLAPIGIKQELAVTAIHQGESEANEARCPITKIMVDPVAFCDDGEIKECCCNVIPGGTIQATIQSSQR